MKIIKLTRLPKDKDQQVAITIRQMIEITVREAWDPWVRALAGNVRASHFNARETAQAYSNYVRRVVEFQFDPDEVELIRLPSAFVKDIRARRPVFGDCDDMALLLGTLLQSQGIPVAYVTISTSPLNREFRHVFTSARIGSQWLNYDPSVAQPYDTAGLRQQMWPVPFDRQPPRVLG